MTGRSIDRKATVLALYVAGMAYWFLTRRRHRPSAHVELRRLFREASAHPEDVDALREKMRAMIRERRGACE